jgi:hypothetical protein
MSLDLLDAAELVEMLEFIHDWLASDHDNLSASLHRFVADPQPSNYDLDRLRHDLQRFAFLLGGDGEALFATPTE